MKLGGWIPVLPRKLPIFRMEDGGSIFSKMLEIPERTVILYFVYSIVHVTVLLRSLANSKW
jgi:hypothetical protein